MKTLYFVTGNKGKYTEVKKRLETLDYKVVQKDLGYPEIQSDSLEEVAKYGVKHVSEKFKETFFLEDAGLFIDTLNGFPGVYSAYVYHSIGRSGILKLLEDKDIRTATFRSVIAYKEPTSQVQLFIGKCSGVIDTTEKGHNGFGYDPIFIPDREKKTFAEMNINEKNSFSHRGKSLQKLIDFLAE